MNETRLCTIEQIEQFLNASAQVAKLSVSHLYNLRKSAGYQAQRRIFTKTHPVCNVIGIRKAPPGNLQPLTQLAPPVLIRHRDH